MHDSAFRIGELVMQTYCDLPKARILEIGAMDVNGSLREAADATTEYVGVDLEEGPAVDVVVKAGEKLPFDDFSFDLVMASSAFEHDPRFWDTFIEMCRVACPGGHIYVNVPSNGGVHRYPLDCWRFYPDAGLALTEYAANRQVQIDLVESFVGKKYRDTWDGWNDFVAIFRRGPSKARLNENFVYKRYPSFNVRSWNSSNMEYETSITEDMQLGRDLRQQVAEQHNRVETLEAELVASENLRTNLTIEVSHLRSSSSSLEQQVQALSSALQAQADTFARLEREKVEAEKIAEKLTADLRISQLEASQLRSAAVGLEQQVQALSGSLQAQADAFARVQEHDLGVIGLLEADLSKLRADHLTYVDQTSAELSRVQERDLGVIGLLEADLSKLRADHLTYVDQTSAELSRTRMREVDLDSMVKNGRVQHERDRTAIEWLRALHIAMAGRPAWWSLLPTLSRRARKYKMLRGVGLFDDQSYLARYSDVVAQGMDPLDHYVAHGMQEGRQRG